MNRSYMWWLGLVLMSLGLEMGRACQTAMVPGSRSKVMGKNYIWPLPHGRAFMNRKNMVKKALVRDEVRNKPKEWTVAYSSLTFNQFAEDFPNGGINSAGVGIEVLLGPAQFPKEVAKGKEAVSELQWIQYILDTSATTREAIENAGKVDIIPLANHAVHYHVCDKAGECAIFEYVDGSLVVSKEEGEDLNPVGCTNSGYASRTTRPTKGINPDINPAELGIELSALPRAVYPAKGDSGIRSMVEAFQDRGYVTPTEEVQAMFGLMSRLSGSPQWQIVYELENGRVHFRTQADGGGRRIKSIALSEFAERDTDCQKAIYYDERSRKSYVLPIMRHDFAASPQAIAEVKGGTFGYSTTTSTPISGNAQLKRTDFAMRVENPSLLAQSSSFLSGAGIDAATMARVRNYASERTKCPIE